MTDEKKNFSAIIIDDDSDDLSIISNAFKENQAFGHIESFSSGEAAINYLSKNPETDVIITDLRMPLMNGFDVLQAIKETPLFTAIPVIILSTSSNPADKEKARILGALKFLTKPDNFVEILSIPRIVINLISAA